MRLRRTRKDARRTWSRRLVDEEAREFVERELEETRELYRTASGDFHLEGLCRDVFAAGATTDVRRLKERGTYGEAFYRDELAPNWEGLSRREREARIERFVELSNMVGAVEPNGRPPDEVRDLIAVVHTKVILLGWAFDRTYGFIDRLFNGPLQYRTHLRRNGE